MREADASGEHSALLPEYIHGRVHINPFLVVIPILVRQTITS
jgi:hypothetical protein